jgi:hypothetical protein
MFRDDYLNAQDRKLERGDCHESGHHLADVYRLPHIREARPMPETAGVVLRFPNVKATGQVWTPDTAA